MAKVDLIANCMYELLLTENEQALLEQDAKKSKCSVETCIVVYLQNKLDLMLHEFD